MLVNSGQLVSTPNTFTSMTSTVEFEIRKIDMGKGDVVETDLTDRTRIWRIVRPIV